MKKFFACSLILAMLLLCFAPAAFAEDGPNILADNNSTFEELTDVTGTSWFAFSGGTLKLGTDGGHTGDNYLILEKPSNAWTSPAIDLYPILKAYKEDGGEYTITCYFRIITDDSAEVSYASAELTEGEDYSMNTLIRGAGEYDDNSFIQDSGYGGNHMATLSGAAFNYDPAEWVEYTDYLTVEAEDFDEPDGKAHTWQFCFDTMPKNAIAIYIDDFSITEDLPEPTPEPTPSPVPTPVPTASPVPTATAAVVATPTEAPENEAGFPVGLAIGIGAAVILLGGGAAYFMGKVKKKTDK